MPLKVHVVIVAFIVAAVFFIWAVSRNAPPPEPVAPVIHESAYAIIINHASWGLNCRNFRFSDTHNDGYSQNTVPKPHQDNALLRISDLCNGKLQCDIPITPDVLGPDPMPECTMKELEVEYRCFSYDRRWKARASEKSLQINCDRDTKK